MEKCGDFFFVCLFPRAQDYLTNITTVTRLFPFFFENARQIWFIFKMRGFCLFSLKWSEFHHFLHWKFTIVLVCEAPQNQRYRFPSFPLVNSKAIWIFPLERLRLSDNGRSFRASTPLSYVLTHCMPPVLHPMESSSRLQNASYLFLA